jgi:hypothetical protein
MLLVAFEDACQACDHSGAKHPPGSGQYPVPRQHCRVSRLPGTCLSQPDYWKKDVQRVDDGLEPLRMAGLRGYVGTNDPDGSQWVGDRLNALVPVPGSRSPSLETAAIHDRNQLRA